MWKIIGAVEPFVRLYEKPKTLSQVINVMLLTCQNKKYRTNTI